MIINNFDILSTYFSHLKSIDDFYFVQILQRKKDGNLINKAKNVLQSFYFYTKEEFLSKKDLIISLCEQNNSRAYFWINPRNNKQIALDCIQKYSELLKQKDCKSGPSVWSKACGQTPSSDYERLWVIDVDSTDTGLISKYIELVNNSRGKSHDKIHAIIPTLNGCHIISNGFDIQQFNNMCQSNNLEIPDIHKNNSTLLYYNEQNNKN